MLSAIAARKAAQVAKQPTQPLDESKTRSTIVAANPSRSDIAKSNIKRKSSSSSRNNHAEQKKRRKEAVRVDTSRKRYFQQDDVISVDESDEVLIIDSKDERSSESSSDSDDEVGIVTPQVLTSVQNPAPSRRSRAWSPSQVVIDSDEEDEEDMELPSTALQTPIASANISGPHRRIRSANRIVHAFETSFVPKPGTNVILVNANDPTTMPGLSQVDTRGGVIIILEPGENMALIGSYELMVLRGTVDVLGTPLRPSTIRHNIFAPKCSPIPLITASRGPDPSSSLDLSEEIHGIGKVKGRSVVLLIRQLQTGVEGLGRICRTFLGTLNADQNTKDALQIGTARLMPSIRSPLMPFTLPSCWENALSSEVIPSVSEDEPVAYASASQPLIALVKGPKKTGKSTFARTLLNRLTISFKRVAYIECDVGQTEFTPPGLVALHVVDRPVFGPPFTHPKTPFQAHYVGASTPRDSPKHYLSAIEALVQSYKLNLQYPDDTIESSSDDNRIDDVIPLVVNTMGWTKGLGADLLSSIEELVQPTAVFEMNVVTSYTGVSRRGDMLSGSSNTSQPRVFRIDSIPSEQQSLRFTAADWRTISLMSYFHSVPSPSQFNHLPDDITPSSSANPSECVYAPICTWNTTLPLLACPPYAVDPREALDEVVLIGAGTEDVVPTEISRVLNGALVALVRSSDPLSRANEVIPYTQGAPPPDPLTSTCIGLALIRGISPDAASHTMHVVTPVPPALLLSASCRTLVKGPLEIPIWGMLDYRDFEGGGKSADQKEMERESVPYLQWGKTEGVGGERRRVRRNLMRRSQIES